MARAMSAVGAHRPVNAAALGALDDEPVAACFRRLAEVPDEVRWTALDDEFRAVHPRATGAEMAAMFAFFRHSLAAAARHEPALYVGDLILAGGDPPAPWQPAPGDAAGAFWRDLCLGEVTVVDVGAGEMVVRSGAHRDGAGPGVAR
jgi:pyochelin synthetase